MKLFLNEHVKHSHQYKQIKKRDIILFEAFNIIDAVGQSLATHCRHEA
jgi:hypothetical protein